MYKPVQKLVFKANSIRTKQECNDLLTNCVMVTHAGAAATLADFLVCSTVRMCVRVCLYTISCCYGNNGGLRTSRTVIASGQGHFDCVCVCVDSANYKPRGGGGREIYRLHTCSLTGNTYVDKRTEMFALRIRTVAMHCINCLNLARLSIWYRVSS